MLKLAVAIGCICMAIFTYHGVKYLQFLKDNKIKQNYANARYREVQQTYNAENDILKEKIKKLDEKRKTNIFRHMAIEQIANQRLVFDEKTGKYVRRRQID